MIGGINDQLASLEAQHNIHELIAQRAPLDSTLTAIANIAGLSVPGAKVAMMLANTSSFTLSLVPSRHFSPTFTSTMQNVAIGPHEVTCGATAHHCREIITKDIFSDTRWDILRETAVDEGFRACWSSPIMTIDDELIGTFDIYYDLPTAFDDATDTSTGLIRRMASLVKLAVLNNREQHRYHSLADSYRSLFVNHPDGVFAFDLEGRFQHCNAALERITGFPEQALIDSHFNDFVFPSYRESTQTAFEDAKRGNARFYETQGIHADGHVYFLEVTNFPIFIGDEITGVYGICRDITPRRHQEAELMLLRRGIEASPNGISISDTKQTDTPIIYVNDAFCRITGYTRQEVTGKNLRLLQGEETCDAAVATLRHAVETETATEVMLLNYRKDGTFLWTRMSINPIFDETGQCTHFIGTQQDITCEKNQSAQIAYQAHHDTLTGLPNRVALDYRLEEALQTSQKYRRFLAVLYLDLDGFKAINDGLGHDIGDELLKAVAARLRQELGPEDTLAYLTGDEFVFVLPNVATHDNVVKTATRILDLFDTPFILGEKTLYISTSIGVACSHDDGQKARTLLQHADLAVEAAKKQGRNTWKWYQDKETPITSEHVMLRHGLYTALREDQFELYYQPIINADNGNIYNVEALIRWHHPTKGLISPGTFIPVAEQTGQIIPLGRWVLRQACHTLAALHAEGRRILPVSVNISSLQFCREGFLDEIRSLLKETRIPPALLELELTESILLDEPEKSIALLHALRDMGLSLAIDDFGTGFSSLSYLRDLPINKVKLDRAFIMDILTSRPNAALVEGIITIAHHMGFVVVAEGIETVEQQHDLNGRHCDLLQGFLYSRPIPLDQLLALPGNLAFRLSGSPSSAIEM